MDIFLRLKRDIKRGSEDEYFKYNKIKEDKKEEKRKIRKYTKITAPTKDSYVVFDTETTGLSPQNHKIIEIGAVKVKEGEITDTFSQLINPGTYIPRFISKITGIYTRDVENKKSISEILPLFTDFCEDLPLIAHNAPFDMNFLLQSYEDIGEEHNFSVIDTCALSRKYNKECEKHSLEYLCAYFDIVNENAHRALSDALATRQLYEIIREKYKTPH
ncbi:MAG: 3'-5' exonuclease [Firmicutes bacterium]|nr:3'-5' exonuclease [Bacillota bacterium]